MRTINSLSCNVIGEKLGLVRRLINLVERGVEQEICPSLRGCTFYADQIKDSKWTIAEAVNYVGVVCRCYPQACKLNMDKQQI